MLEALIAGDRDPAGLADLAKRRLRSKPGAEYFARLNPSRVKKRAIQQPEAMGYRVTLEQAS
jgi:hypothetical protein